LEALMGYPVGKGAMKKNINLNLRRVKARVKSDNPRRNLENLVKKRSIRLVRRADDPASIL